MIYNIDSCKNVFTTKWTPVKFNKRCKKIIKQKKRDKMIMVKQTLIYLTYEYTFFILMLTNFKTFV